MLFLVVIMFSLWAVKRLAEQIICAKTY